MNKMIGIEELMADKDSWQIIDVRSPAEFEAGHIPGALNLPVFTDEERARVGTLYKQVSPESAMKEGFKIAGSKMTGFLEQAASFPEERKLLIHCWRGGKRSEAMQWLFDFSGKPSSRLDGGYKSFRQLAHSFFNELPFDLKILGGFTGSGKTEILKEITARGHQVIDLEKLAHHKGSAFGSVGEHEQPSNEQFENELFIAMFALDPHRPVWLENESKSIGKVYIPDGLWHKMKKAVLYSIEVNTDQRLDRIIEYYSNPSTKDFLVEAFGKIRERLGGLEYKNAIYALNQNDLRSAAAIALHYYDKSYTFQINNWNKENIIRLADCDGFQETVNRLLSF